MSRFYFRRGWMVGATLAALLLAAVPGSVDAKKRPNNQPPAAPPPAAPATPPTDTSGAELTAAQQAYKTATLALDALTKKANDDFQTSDPYLQAKKQVALAQTAYDAAATPVLERVDSDPAYIQAMAQSKSARDQIQALRTAGDPSPEQIGPLAQQEMSSTATARSLKSDALLSDNTVADAKGKLTAAQSALAALHTQFQKNLTTTAEYVTAKQAVDNAKTKLTALQTASAK
jgi:hypothetical protein